MLPIGFTLPDLRLDATRSTGPTKFYVNYPLSSSAGEQISSRHSPCVRRRPPGAEQQIATTAWRRRLSLRDPPCANGAARRADERHTPQRPGGGNAWLASNFQRPAMIPRPGYETPVTK